MAAGGLSRSERKAAERDKILREEQQRNRLRQVSRILKKAAAERSAEECRLLAESEELVKELQGRSRRREGLKRRQQEVCDDPGELRRKVRELAVAVQNAKYLVIYTGAGISTAASIPDYRGPNGVWTLLQKGRSISAADLSEAEPTLTHMSIARLHEQKLAQHVVSQNCDGLHLRSGLPRSAISELHGNMYIEVCTSCTPNREYLRVFDVTERTALHRHQTGRTCHKCGAQLRDTIVHFGERGILGQPLNWEAATEAASKADTILCLGSSLKVLKKYPHLWCMTKPPSRRPKLYIVNLQWTPKDDLAALKLHGKCDDVMQLLMDELGLEIPHYNRWQDPIFSLATPLRADEEGSHSRKPLVPPQSAEETQSRDLKEQGTPLSSVPFSGGWFGRGCTKGTKRKKV
ncbi:NAD-dependent protein deacetylase sirtuin-7 [Vombatus ursinus]|uniref:NAD-dependent protein deacetylase sirtuin-7 n=1 Tax=Vombatus ursinus TaxID=29139 RepID=A0A4X2KNT3_VOMUR|nr:NAD-dependent protein deacetylase sirtuin-7 [Vombatus ursinus]